MEVVIGIVVLGLILIITVVSITNRFARLEFTVRESFANVDVALKRRHDLIPNLVEVTKGYAKYEQEALQRVIEARNAAQAARTPAELSDRENTFGRTLHGAFALAESYPDLKASGAFQQLQSELIDSEDRIAAARRFYNSNVREFNVLRESFPSSLLAGSRAEKQFLQIEDPAERQVPTLNLNL